MLHQLMSKHPYGLVKLPVLPMLDAPRFHNKDGSKVVSKLIAYLRAHPESGDPKEEVLRLASAWLEANE